MATRILLTGASSGIGRSLALAYAARGHSLGLVARRTDLLAELAETIRTTGGIAHAVPADVTDSASLTTAIHTLETELGGFEVAIANAGVAVPSRGTHPDPAADFLMMQVNFMGVVNTFAAALPGMLARGRGYLVAIGSMAGYKGLPGSAGYCASKAAVLTYCEALRIELAPRGIAVTCVCPGFVTTPMTAPNRFPMPWLLSADRAADIIVRGLARRPKVLNFPTRMRYLMHMTRWLPDRVIRRRVPIEHPPT